MTRLKPKITQNLSRATIEQQVGSLVTKVGIVTVVIDNHMAVIQVQIKKNKQRMCCWLEVLNFISS